MTHLEIVAMAQEAGFPLLPDSKGKIGEQTYERFMKFMHISQEIERVKFSSELRKLREIKKAAEMLVNCKGRYHSELNMDALTKILKDAE